MILIRARFQDVSVFILHEKEALTEIDTMCNYELAADETNFHATNECFSNRVGVDAVFLLLSVTSVL